MRETILKYCERQYFNIARDNISSVAEIVSQLGHRHNYNLEWGNMSAVTEAIFQLLQNQYFNVITDNISILADMIFQLWQRHYFKWQRLCLNSAGVNNSTLTVILWQKEHFNYDHDRMSSLSKEKPLLWHRACVSCDL